MPLPASLSVSLVDFAEEVAGQREARQASKKAPCAPAAGDSPASSLNEKFQVDLPFLGDVVALHAMDVSSKCAPPAPVCSKSPLEGRDALAGSRTSVFGRPPTIQMGAGGEWGYEIWMDFFAERNSRLHFQ